MQNDKANLIFITSRFPVGNSSEYISHSLPFLAKNFNIRIISADAAGKLTRPLPQGVRFTRLPEFTKFKRLLFKIKALFSKDAKRHIKNAHNRSFKNHKLWLNEVDMLACGRHLYNYLSELHEIKSGKPLLIYSFLSHEYVYGTVMIKEDNPNIKLAMSIRSVDQYRLLHGYRIIGAINDIENACDMLQFECNDNRNFFIENLTLDKLTEKKARVIRFGIKPNNELTVNNQDIQTLNIITHSQHGDNQGLYMLCDALKLVNEGYIHWTHLRTENEDIELKRYINNTAGRNPRITCNFTNNMKYSERVKFYTENSIHCIININEILSYEFLESISFGIMPIAVNIGGVSDVINEQNGILLPEDTTAEQLAEVINKTTTLPKKEIINRGVNAARTCIDLFCAEKNFDQLSHSLMETIYN